MKRLLTSTALIFALAGPAFAGDTSTLGHAGASTMTGGTDSEVVPGGSTMTGAGSDGDEARPGGSSMTGGDNLADADTTVRTGPTTGINESANADTAIDNEASTNSDDSSLGYAGASSMTGGTDSEVVPGGSTMTGAGSDANEDDVESVISTEEGKDVLETVPATEG